MSAMSHIYTDFPIWNYSTSRKGGLRLGCEVLGRWTTAEIFKFWRTGVNVKRNFWPATVCQLFCFSAKENKAWK